MKILIVDDKEQNLYMLQVLFEGHGYEVVSAGNGAEALEKARQDSPDIVISDVLMPVMDGFQLCRECKSDDTLRKIPFVFYTATYTGKEDEEFALSLGADRFLIKPMEPDRFTKIIRDVLKNHKNTLLTPSEIPTEKDEAVILKEYNKRLVNKIEKKMLDLEKEITERKQAENDLKRRRHDLGERVKELHCLYNISKIAEEMDLPIEETTQRIVNLIPPAWQYPEITYARIFLHGKEFKTEGFQTAVWKQASDIKVYGKIVGTIEVYYSEEKATDFEGPFMKEERNLIESISERLGRIIERKQAKEEKQKLETQLVQAQKMEAIGTLAGGIAHDFNNILGGIIGYAELAKMKAPQESNVVADLNQVIESGNRAADLIKQILTISRQHNQEKRPVQLRYIVNEALKLLRATLPTTIEIRGDLAKDSGVVNADPTQMHQVIMNLVTNAGHAMQEDGGVLEVSLANVEMDSFSASKHLDMDAGSYLRLTVSDTGHGMAPEIVERIFDPYFTTKDIGEGTGLGLSVAQGIVKAHGGAIIIYSEPGNGTTFHVYLHIIRAAENAEKEESEPPLPTGNECILFIDDEQILVEIGSQMLERLGYKVVAKRSSVQALELFRAEPDKFDLVITDMTMPHMTGDKLAQELIRIRPDIPVILCTGHSKRISEEKAKGLGIRAFVMKPISTRVMAESVRKVLDAG